MREHQRFINGIIHGLNGQYQCLRALQEAVDFKARIPKHFLSSEKAEWLEGEFGIIITKQKVKELREEIISEITDVILNKKTTEYGEEMLPDNYSRLFHALAILKLEKDTELLPEKTDNYIYNATYMIWRLDDGSMFAGDMIVNAMWYMAEEIKKRSEKAQRCQKE